MKRNAIAGRAFAAWAALEAHLSWWMRKIADQRVHGTTGELPAVRFIAEQASLKPLNDRAPFEQARELSRRVLRDATVEVDTNRYSVPWRLIGEPVQVSVTDGELRVHHAGREVARHPELGGRRQVRCLPEHLQGIVGYRSPKADAEEVVASSEIVATLRPAALQRDLTEYEAVVGGGW